MVTVLSLDVKLCGNIGVLGLIGKMRIQVDSGFLKEEIFPQRSS